MRMSMLVNRYIGRDALLNIHADIIDLMNELHHWRCVKYYKSNNFNDRNRVG